MKNNHKQIKTNNNSNKNNCLKHKTKKEKLMHKK